MRRQTTPLLISSSGLTELERLSLDSTEHYNEKWIQKLVHDHPGVLPIGQIEPAFEEAIPICRELPLPAGYLDNLLVTPRGDLVLVECKLWRNPEARRKVIAQIIDYAKDLQNLGFDGFQKAIASARKAKSCKLHELANASVGEAEFCDYVSRNLRRSRALLIIVGDGISEEVEELTDFLQQHAGLQFTLALVQLAVYSCPDGSSLVVPSVPMRTVTITRGIVELSVPGASIREATDTTIQSTKSSTLSEADFFSELDEIRPGTSKALLALFERGSDLALTYSVKKAMSIRLPIGDTSFLPLVIYRDGVADTGYLSWGHKRLRELSSEYLSRLARRLPKGEFRATPKGGSVWVDGRRLEVWDVLASGDIWLEETRELRRALFSQSEEAGETGSVESDE